MRSAPSSFPAAIAAATSFTFFTAALLLPGLPPAAFAQTTISAPDGWQTQTRANGVRVFTPPDLAAGEVYSVTIYDSAAGDGKTLEEYLRAFAGPVGGKAGQLAAPLKIKVTDGRIVVGTGAYAGPNGAQLGVIFLGVSLDGGANIHLARTLLSGQDGLLARYESATSALTQAMLRRAKGETGDNVVQVPPVVTQKMKPGGALVPGVYAGNQHSAQELRYRFRIYIYANGEYRITDHNDKDLKDRYFDERVGNISYNRNSGQLDIDSVFDMSNPGGSDADTDFCFYGRNSAGKPVIYAEDDAGFHTRRTSLVWVAPPTKRLAKSAEKEREDAIEAERNRYKWVTAPGKGVPTGKIATVLLDSKYNGSSVEETVYLLLKDGTVYADLPVPPDELDVLRSRQKEPDKWGKWRKVAGGYKVSWAGAPYQALPGSKVLPGPAQVKLNGRWGTGRASNDIITASSSQWGVTFSKAGRFRKDSRSLNTSSIGFGDQATHMASGSDDEGSFAGGSGPGFAVSSSQKKKNPNGNREGDYSINGYVLTLRYDNGKVARLPFFFGDTGRKSLWFEGNRLELDDKK